VQHVNDITKPASLLSFVDESDVTIDDAQFLIWPDPDNRWINMPTDRHGLAGTLAFVDGHVEKWRWKAEKKFVRNENYWMRIKNSDDLSDLRRIQQVILPVIKEPPPN
jgi:prepilin-type processing-associated H-X9-DG protein